MADPTPEELAGLSEDEQDYLVASSRDHDHEEFIPLEEVFAKRGIDINRLHDERRHRRAVGEALLELQNGDGRPLY